MAELNPTDLASAMANGLAIAAQNAGAMLPGLVLSIIAAGIVLVIGLFVSDLLGQLARRVMDFFKVESVFKKYKVEDALGGTQITPILAVFVRWYVMLLFLQFALAWLNMSALTQINQQVLFFVPLLIGSALLVIAAAVAGEWVREAIKSMHKFYMQATIAQVAKWSIVGIAVLTGLQTIGFRVDLLNSIIVTLMQGVALAIGLAFGLGGQKDAADIIRKGRRKFDI
jgi:flagellar biosynthesis protein FliQ